MAITTTEVDPGIPEFWLAQAIGFLRAQAMMARLVRRDVSDQVQTVGDTVNIIKRGSLTVRDKAEGSAITSDSPADSKVAVLLDRHKYVSWFVEDRAASVAVDAAIDYIEDGMGGIAEAIEADLLGLYADIANDVGTGGTNLTLATLLAARQQLNVQRAPMQGRALIISPKDEVALLNSELLVAADKRGDDGKALREAMMGRIYGFDAYMSQLVPSTGSGPATTHNVAFHRNAFALVSRPLGMPEQGTGVRATVMTDPVTGVAMRYTRQWDSTQLATRHTIDVLYGVKSIDEDRHAVEVLT
ncbi:MAG: P22 phage major capsid protein family protein [Myxococcota bacterium]